VSKLANQWIQIFRAGDYGAQGSFSEADLDRVVANYQPGGGHEAPVVIGHPQENAPAYGWVEAIKRSGDLLLGKFRDVDPAFAEMVETRKFPKRSASFYRTPDGKSISGLRHVGFLGANPPVVKGLADCKFADASEQVVVEFQESVMADETVTAITGFKAWLESLISGSKQTAGATSFSEADVKRIATEAASAAATEAVKPVQAKLDAAEAKFAERETALGTSETRARVEAAIAKLTKSGRYIPAFDKMGLPLVFAELAKATETVEFGEGDAKKKQTPLEVFVNFMEGLKAIVPTDPVYTGAMPTKGAKSTIQFSEDKHRADQNSVDLANLSNDRATEKKISFAEAMKEVLHEHPELAVPGGASAGQA
jgi:hypothetical protein